MSRPAQPAVFFRIAGFLLLCVFVCGCGQIDTYEVVTGVPAQPFEGNVTIFTEEEGVPPGVTEVALVQAIGSGTDASAPNVISRLQQMAQRLGCNAVIRLKIDAGGTMVAAFGVAVQMPIDLVRRATPPPGGVPSPPRNYLVAPE